MSIPRQAIRSLRALHTSSRLLNDAPTATPNPKSLGFGDYTGRTRSLPTIDIPASSRRNVGMNRSPKNETKPKDQRQARPAGPNASGRNPEARKFPEEKNRRQSKSPLKPVQAQQSTEGGDEFFTMSGDIASGSKSRPTKDNRKTSMDVVDIDFNLESISANANANKARPKRGTRTTAASGSRKNQTQGEARGSKGRSTGSEPAKREDDRSSEGIFGRASLLFPLRMGARSAEQSVWAEGMKSEDGTFIPLFSLLLL
jgi:hypothetical protein